MSTTRRDASQDRRFAAAIENDNPAVCPPPHGIAAAIHQPETETDLLKEENQPDRIHSFPDGFFVTNSTSQELKKHSQWIFNLMTTSKNEDAAASLLSKLERMQLPWVATLLTLDLDLFVGIARNKNGAKLLQMLIGKSKGSDNQFSDAILSHFFDFMTDRNAFFVALRGLRVFDEKKRKSMYQHTLDHALALACDQHGCISLNDFITELDHPDYRGKLLDIVTHNALSLSFDEYGNLVVQHVLKLNDLHCKQTILVSLRGRCVDLSFNKYGRCVVDMLLEVGESLVVVEELLACNRDRLLTLAKSEYGKNVVGKALRLTRTTRADLFTDLVHMLNPKCNIAAIETALEKKDAQLHISAPVVGLGSKEEEKEAEKEVDWLKDFVVSLKNQQNESDFPVKDGEDVLNYNTAWIDPDLLAQYDSVRPKNYKMP